MKTAMLAMLALLAAHAPAAARQLKANDPVAPEAGKALVLIHSNGTNLRLVREVDAVQRAAWEAKRAEAFTKASAKYAKLKKAFDRDVKIWNAADPQDRAMMQKPEVPVPVTQETFFYPPAELQNFEDMFSGRVFSKDGDTNSYLLSLDPGTYVLYGPMFVGGNGAAFGTCYCMGSIKFDVGGGAITDIGELRFPKPNQEGLLDYRPASATTPRPPQLGSAQVVPGKARAAGKMPNYFGVTVDRIPAIAGVLAYQRDVPLDVLNGNAPVASIR